MPRQCKVKRAYVWNIPKEDRGWLYLSEDHDALPYGYFMEYAAVKGYRPKHTLAVVYTWNASGHSVNDRHSEHRTIAQAKRWVQEQLDKLLPVPSA